MKTRPPRVQIPHLTTGPDFDDEPGYYSDIYYPNLLPGESEIAYRLRHAFTSPRYAIRSIELMEPHPVWVVRAVCKDTRCISDHRLFFRHVRDVLRQAGLKVKKDELTVDRTGDRVLVTLLWRNVSMECVEVKPVLEGEFDPIP